MNRTQPIRATRFGFVAACLATLTLALAACGNAPPASPSASVNSKLASQAPGANPGPTTVSAGANQPQTIHVIEQTTNISKIRVGSSTGCTGPACPGDYLIGEDPVVDPATSERVGSLVFACFRVDTVSGLLYCPAVTITLWERGQIVFATKCCGGGSETAPITGGTDEFLGATGSVTNQTLNGNGDYVITITTGRT
jgi:hypothetical protein